jgi:hypothetical protein
VKTHSIVSFFAFVRRWALLACFAATMFSAHATPTLWTGPNTNYTQSAAHPADVLVPGAVSLSRNFSHWLFNTNTDHLGASTGTPSDTEWAFGALTNFASLSYKSFALFRNGNLSGVLVGVPPKPMVVHLINENIYLSVTFTAWPQGGGFFAYTRSTPAAVITPSPVVTVTDPASGATFAAPADVAIAAGATVSGGTVTNVAFFGNGSLLGSRQSAPFSITASNLSAGSFVLKSVATAGGISTTSSVVNISVVTPVITSLSASAAVNNQFSFGYSANPGLRYVVESSSNLFNWTPLVTNVATGDPAFFTNGISEGANFYRVGRLPNP